MLGDVVSSGLSLGILSPELCTPILSSQGSPVTAAVKESLQWEPPQGWNAGKAAGSGLCRQGDVCVSFPCGFFIISALGRVREKVRGEKPGICISLCLSSPTWEIWQILWPCLRFFVPKQPQPYRKIQLVVSKLSPDTRSSHTIKNLKWGCSFFCFFLSHHLGKCKTPLLPCEMLL